MKKFTVAIILLIPLLSISQIINIPANYPTIQQGIDAANNGDIILVDTGTYVENIDFLGKKITVASHYLNQKDSIFIHNTIIDGSDPSNPDNGSVVTFSSGEDTTSCLYGFTIRGGTGTLVIDEIQLRTGGGIVIGYSGCKIESNIIKDNHCIINVEDAYAIGGGISAGPAEADNYIIVRNNQIYNNLVWSQGLSTDWNYAWGQGGGIMLAFNGTIENNSIHSNICKSTHGYGVGGGIRLQTDLGDLTFVRIRSNTIKNNESISENSNGFAGGIGCSMVNTIIEYNEIKLNKASGIESRGSGLYFDLGVTSNAYINSNYIIENHCVGNLSYGGAMAMYRSYEMNIVNNLIIENSAINGGALFLEDSYPKIINNTIAQNIAQLDGGGMYFLDVSSGAYIANTILWNDSAGGQVNEISISNPDIIDIVYSNIMNGWSGTGNIDQDPLFVNSGNNPYQLSFGSPCIDEGIQDTSGLNLPIDDLLGCFRIWDGNQDGDTIIDMGVYEYDSPLVGIESHSENNISEYDELILFPNPTHSTLTIELPTQPSTNTSLTISNTNGQQLFTQPITKPQTEIDISNLPTGIYIVKVWNDREVMVRKVIKQ